MSNLPAITLKQAIESLKSKHPEEITVIEAAVRKDIVSLGTDEAFALRDNSGEIRAYKQSLNLSVSNGGLVQPVQHGPYVVSAQGYEMWAEATGASVIFPKEVLVDGQWQANPAVVRDGTNRRILCIYARAVAFRFSSKGIPQVSDWTTIFDTPSYRLIDLLGKAKKIPQAFRLYPAEMEKPEGDGTWAKYPFDESTNLWVNTAHEEALSWYAQILNREKKAIDFAQTFAKRNALKHLSGVQRTPVVGVKKSGNFENPIYSDDWTFPVLCWRPTSGNIIKWDATRYLQVQEQAGGLITGSGEAFAPGKVNAPERMKIQTGMERTSDEAGFEDLERQTDPEDQECVIDVPHEPVQDAATIAPKPEPAKDEPKQSPSSDEDKKVWANYATTREMFPGEFDAACAELQLSPNIVHTVPQAIAIIGAINRALDA